MLTERQRRFVDAYEGEGTGVRAARVAGYTGTDRSLTVEASKLLRHPAIRAALEERGVTPPAMRPGRRKNAPPTRAAIKPTARVGSATERVEIAMAIARNKKLEEKIRLDAIELAAKLCGELGPGRYTSHAPPVAPSTPAAASPTAPATPERPRIRLVVSASDAALTKDGSP